MGMEGGAADGGGIQVAGYAKYFNGIGLRYINFIIKI
jgi:hypothetical protein